ncbi:MAG TPA: beta-propeller domain-containing protein [Burkholderiaceae bacterium]|nr:beta-propeller domain-containing protein [Burkholderiaceae bacterium]
MRLVALCLVLACAAGAASASTVPKSTLKPFASEREFDELLERWRAQAREAMERRRADAVGGGLAQNAAPGAPAAKAMADGAVAEKKEADSITNVQTTGVDEGGIVKRAGEHLVILRRGRLFTVKVGGDALKPVAMVDAYAPDASPAGAWYDELLIHGNVVVVVGYSYARGGTEIGLFELGRDGALAYRATHHLKSHDYYSSRNYASRLVGSKLVFYSPMQVQPWAPNPEAFLPQWRRWNASTPDNWQRILPATRIFRTDDEIDPFAGGAALHTVTACDLAQPEAMRCEASAVLAPPGRVFYVSAASVYVWTTEWQRRSPWGRPSPEAPMNRSAVFRLPLDGGAPSALKTTGAPIDQLSFLEDERGHLNVLLRAQGRGEGMWNAERGAGELALLRVPLADFGDGRGSAPRSAYRPLPGAAGPSMHNRFVGDWLLYGQHGLHAAHVLRYAERDADAQPLAISHGVERIEALGRDAVLVGNAGRDLHFTSLRLGPDARIADRFVHRDAAQGETRTHGFFYRATARDEGLLGLPVVGRARSGVAAHRGASAAVLFLHNRALALHPVGELQAAPLRSANDDCKASCVDWYGNARPIFLGDRVIALLGYELVEGRLSRAWGGARIDELRRVSFGPQALSPWGRD